MSKEKQIEEITKILDSNCEGIPDTVCQENSCSSCKANQIIGAGYRKQSEGEWKERTVGNGWNCWSEITCSECGVIFEDRYGNIPKKYCPNCGAKMKGGEE